MPWQIAGGTVTGTLHQQPLHITNNQDSFHWEYKNDCGDFLVAVVADGCGSSQYSEVGAITGSRLIVRKMSHSLAPMFYCQDTASLATTLETALDITRRDILSMLDRLVNSLVLLRRDLVEARYVETVRQFLLFTVVGIILSERTFVLFSIGDGTAFLNGAQIDLGTYPEDAPPYMAYDLIKDSLKDPTPELYKFQIHCILPEDTVQSCLIGTDGVSKWLLPVYDISEFWTDDRYFQNSDQVRRKLAVISKTTATRCGPLRDDTTLIVVRRRRHSE